MAIDYEKDLIPLYDIADHVFNENMKYPLVIFYTKYKEAFLKTDLSKQEFDEFIKTNSLLVKNLLSNTYLKYTLSKYFSKEGIVFFIITILTSRSKMFYSELS